MPGFATSGSELGGRRKKIRDDSPNLALRNASFRNYADYMLTEDFRRGIAELIKLAGQSRTAYMCAERVYFHCHRMLVSDWLVAHGHDVFHIDGATTVKRHDLWPKRDYDGLVIIAATDYSGRCARDVCNPLGLDFPLQWKEV
jgi:uncharacterized protein (DUF488 family)